jgi:hypothetical protein
MKQLVRVRALAGQQEKETGKVFLLVGKQNY